MKKILIICLFIFFFGMENINANSCDYSELSRLKTLASNVNVSYDYLYDSFLDDMIFSIRFDNLTTSLIIEDQYKNRYPFNGSDSLILNNYSDGNKYTFSIYTTRTNCLNKNLITLYVNLPKYNSFYDDSICFGLEDYYMCQMWYQHGLNAEEFRKKVQEYKNIDIPEEPVDEDILNNVFDFIYEYYYYFLGLSAIMLLIIIYTKSRNKDFDLRT